MYSLYTLVSQVVEFLWQLSVEFSQWKILSWVQVYTLSICNNPGTSYNMEEILELKITTIYLFCARPHINVNHKIPAKWDGEFLYLQIKEGK